ncbi:glycosyltransferase [Photobacterium kishitanii]|uniref:Glycosyltransferase 2-like domain-containing protein n=1 Tax=Photobacterium kishitanii TaxID=318456 RepID=A0A2T3KG16_9GAMM|nr:glycosyltransferase [Photobacterium kishitanii]PSU97723.1 hypothetical protein C9J27_15340 [Photobacterium kishitanii]
MEVTFTVGICIYDGVSVCELKRSIESILNQDCCDFELIVYLDGVSNQELINLINGYSDKLKVINGNVNRGLSFGLNEIIKNMSGDYFVRMDADDVSLNNRLSRQLEFLIDNPDIDIVGSGIRQKNIEDINSKELDVFYPEGHDEIVKYFKYKNPIAHPTVVFRKSVFNLVPSYPVFSIKNEDTLMWLSAINAGLKFANIPEVLYVFNYNDETESRRLGFKKAFSDYVDRVRVQLDLGCSFKDIILSLSVFFISLTPLYKVIRKFYFENLSSK